MSATDRIPRAESALDAVAGRPEWARELAAAVIAERADDEAASVAYRAVGLSWKETGSLPKAVTALRKAIAVAERAGTPVRAAQARMSLVVVLSDRGQTEAALAEAALAERVLTGVDRARLLVNLGLVLQRTGRVAEAMTAYAEAQPVLQTAGDARFEAILLNLRGTLSAYLGRGQDAETDLLRAEKLTRDNDYHLLHAIVQQNLGFVASRSGDIPAALARLDRAVPMLAERGRPTADVLVDKADVFLAAGIAAEARAAVALAIEEQQAKGFRYNLAESHLMHARASLLDQDPAAAEAASKTARLMFARQRRDGWIALARQVEVAARYARGERTAQLLREAAEVADRLQADGWSVAPHEARLLAGRLAAELGRLDQARGLLAEVARHRSRGNAEIRALGWHAHALHALHSGRTGAAERALHAGLRVHAENNAVLGATDLRAHASARGEELATLGLRLALDRGDARAVLRWAETWRAASLRRRPVRPPDDAELAADLASLRAVVAEITMVESPTRGAARPELSRLNAERLRLEQAVRDRSRYARGTYAPEAAFEPAVLVAALGPRVLVEFVRLDDDLHAVTVRGGQVRRWRLGSYAAVLKQLEVVRFTMNRMSRRFGNEAVQAAAVQAYDHSRRVLDGLLFGPLRGVVGGGAGDGDGDGGNAVAGRDAVGGGSAGEPELVIVPTGSLHALPWTALPTCAERAVSVTPSARLWLGAVEAAQSPAEADGPGPGAEAPQGTPPRTALMAGPGLAHAEPEIAALADRYPDAVVLTGPTATAADTAAALDGAALAHVATHGRFRSDHPLFSSLDTADGPLYVYDLERLSSTPQVLVLSACESALSGVRPGDELMGLASAVFALGTRTLIASVTPVNDHDTRTLMLALHAALAKGLGPAAALAAASAETGIGGFVCFGFGG